MGYNLTIALINGTKKFLTPIKEIIHKGVSIVTGSEMLAPNGINYYRYKYFNPWGLNVRLFHENKNGNSKKDFILYLRYNHQLGLNVGCISLDFLISFEVLSDRSDKIIIITLTDNK